MKAIVCTKYGPPEVLEVREVAKPVPVDNEILVKVYATTVTAADFRIRSFTLPLSFLLSLPIRLALGVRRPKKAILGVELAGKVEAVGRNVRLFREGDEVFAATLAGFGAYAEYKCLPENGPIATKPCNLTYEEAAAIPIGARTALYYLRKADIRPGQRVLIYGASGSVGTYAVQLAKYWGAHVTAVCSTRNLELVRTLGADRVIDYTAEGFSGHGQTYDVVFDTVDKAPFAQCMKALTGEGIYLNAARVVPDIRMLWAKLTGRKLVLSQASPETAEALEFLKGLVEAGRIQVVIDRFYSFEGIVDAHRYVDKGHKKGNVVVSVYPSVITSPA
jgi:NADPH:quinone reductase-like Zn-dependent oxidoreductase